MLVRRSEHRGEDGAKVRAQAAEGRRGWTPGKGHPKADVTGVGEQRKGFVCLVCSGRLSNNSKLRRNCWRVGTLHNEERKGWAEIGILAKGRHQSRFLMAWFIFFYFAFCHISLL